MKKVFSILAAVVVVAFMTTSCDKNCHCKTTVTANGNSQVTETEINLEQIFGENTDKKCSDLNESAELMGIKTEVKCH